MSDATVIHVAQQAIIMILIMSAPTVLVSLLVGFIVALIMTVTSIQEQTLSFVPKTLAVFGLLLAVGPWMLSAMVGFVVSLWSSIPTMLGH